MLAARSETDEIGWPLIQSIHRMWFRESTFPDDAGKQRGVMVVNRKGTAVSVGAIVDGVEAACGDWRWRQENVTPEDAVEQIEFFVAEANELVIRVYDIHPFLDGTTRVTFSLRNLLLVRGDLYAVQALFDQDLRREEHNRVIPRESS